MKPRCQLCKHFDENTKCRMGYVLPMDSPSRSPFPNCFEYAGVCKRCHYNTRSLLCNMRVSGATRCDGFRPEIEWDISHSLYGIEYRIRSTMFDATGVAMADAAARLVLEMIEDKLGPMNILPQLTKEYRKRIKRQMFSNNTDTLADIVDITVKIVEEELNRSWPQVEFEGFSAEV